MHLKCVTIQMKTFSLLSTITSYYNLDVFNLNWNLPAIYYNSDLQDLSAFLPDSKLDATLIATILWARTSCIGAPRTITLPYFLPFSFFTIFGRKSTLFFIWHDPFSFACPLTGLPQLLLFKKKIWCLMLVFLTRGIKVLPFSKLFYYFDKDKTISIAAIFLFFG